MCELCHERFMDEWRAEDAASEFAEAIDGYRDDTLGAAHLEQDDEEPEPVQRRSAA